MPNTLAHRDPDITSNNDRRRARRQLAALAASMVLLVAAIALVAVRLLDHDGPDGDGRDGGPAPSAGTSPRGARSGDENPAGQDESQDGEPDVTWQDVAGIKLPFSRTHGPRVTDHGRAAGYSRTREGAALAAVQVLTRTSATAGPNVYRPVLAGQIDGANAAAMAQALDERYQQLRHQPGKTVRDGDPIPGNNATPAGYLVTGYDETAGTAQVDVLLTAPDLRPGQVVDFSVALQWTEGDWRVLAPPDGDWGTLARLLNGPPPGTLDYRQLS